jgi:hypothetical protein
VRAYEVLGGEDLDGAAGDGGRADAVRADDLLAPVRADLEAEPVGLAQHRPAALAPQHPGLRVRHDHDVLGDVPDRQQPLPQYRKDVPQRGVAPAPLDLVRTEHSGPEVVVGVHAGAQHPPPGLPDDRPRIEPGALAGQRRVAHLVEHPSRLRCVHRGEPRHVHRRVHHWVLPESLSGQSGPGRPAM